MVLNDAPPDTYGYVNSLQYRLDLVICFHQIEDSTSKINGVLLLRLGFRKSVISIWSINSCLSLVTKYLVLVPGSRELPFKILKDVKVALELGSG